jgi:hypothetical protein
MEDVKTCLIDLDHSIFHPIRLKKMMGLILSWKVLHIWWNENFKVSSYFRSLHLGSPCPTTRLKDFSLKDLGPMV